MQVFSGFPLYFSALENGVPFSLFFIPFALVLRLLCVLLLQYVRVPFILQIFVVCQLPPNTHTYSVEWKRHNNKVTAHFETATQTSFAYVGQFTQRFSNLYKLHVMYTRICLQRMFTFCSWKTEIVYFKTIVMVFENV